MQFEESVTTEFKKESNIGAIQHFAELSAGAGSEMFKVNKDGLFMGADNYTDAPVKVAFNGNFTFGSVSANKYIQWDGSTFTIRGSLNADDISGGTITGRTLQTATTGYRVKVNGSNNKIEFLSNDSVKASIYTDSTYDVNIDTADAITFLRNGTGYLTFDYDSGAAAMHATLAVNGKLAWSTGRFLQGKSADIECDGNFIPNGDNAYTLGNNSVQWLDGRFEDIHVDDLYVADGCTGCAYQELNLLTDYQKKTYDEKQREWASSDIIDSKEYQKELKIIRGEAKKFNPTGFEMGDVLAWKGKKLVKCKKDACPCVVAVASKNGLPIVLGAEDIKVIGKCKEGQYLVTSETEGHARAWDNGVEGNPPAGIVIAMAMTDKDTEESGTIRAMIQKF